MSSETLIENIRNCRLCEDKFPHGVRPVLQFDPSAKILIAGQAPGRKVHESGIPFDDASGDRLRDWLGVDKATFYDEKQFAILPMAFCFPGTGKSGDLAPPKICAQTWRDELMAQFESLELVIIIGQYAKAYHAPNAAKSVTDAVKRWREHWPQQLILPHPSPRNNIWLKRNQWFDDEVVPALKLRVQEIL